MATQEPQMLPGEEVPNTKLRKKKPLTQVVSAGQKKGGESKRKESSQPSLRSHKGTKKSLKNVMSPPLQQADRSTPDSFPDSSGHGEEYRALRRKYLLLEEESFSLGKELGEVEAGAKTLEDEKLALLDQLVVLEGLINPSEIQPKGGF